MSNSFRWLILFGLLILLVLSSLQFGSVKIPIEAFFGEGSELERLIVRESRWPRLFAAVFGGAALSLGGLLMQTLFRNPLAGPSVLGLSSGASLAVAFLTLGGSLWASSQLSVTLAAILGAAAVLAIILLVANRFADVTSVLIVGLMLSFFTSAVISFLQSQADATALKTFVFWGFGSFSSMSFRYLPWFVGLLGIMMVIAIFLVKPLNSLLPGEMHAQSMGVNVKRLRMIIVLLTGILTGVVTAFCGPIAFIGLASPHLARFYFKTVDHRHILPGSLILGAVVALLCDLIARWPFNDSALPLNTVCAFMGAPVVIYLIFRGRKKRILL
jgi:iron complex transport system permease protein